MLKAYSKFLNAIEKAERAVLALSMAAMVVLMLYQVILRYVFSASNSWSEELVRYLFILDVMLAASIAVRRNSHLQIDVLINCFSPKLKRIFTIAATLAGIVFLALLFWYSLDLCMTATSNVSPGLGIPMSIPYACVPLGAVLMILTSIEVILKTVEELRHEEEVPTV